MASFDRTGKNRNEKRAFLKCDDPGCGKHISSPTRARTIELAEELEWWVSTLRARDNIPARCPDHHGVKV